MHLRVGGTARLRGLILAVVATAACAPDADADGNSLFPATTRARSAEPTAKLSRRTSGP